MSLVLQVLLLLALVTVVSKGAGTLSNRFGQPAVFGEVLAGLLLGPSLLNVLRWSVFAPRAGDAPRLDPGGIVQIMAEIGVILLMFVAGMETDLREMRRVGRVAFWAALGFGSLVAGLVRELRPLRLAGLALLGLAVGKVFIVDLAALESIWRVASFLALGLLLLAGAFAYQRIRKEGAA